MTPEEIKKLAEHVQQELHAQYLPGFYFDEESVEDIIRGYFNLEPASGE